MNIYRSTRTGKTYILSYCMGRMTGRVLQAAQYDWFAGQISPWFSVAKSHNRDFVLVANVNATIPIAR